MRKCQRWGVCQELPFIRKCHAGASRSTRLEALVFFVGEAAHSVVCGAMNWGAPRPSSHTTPFAPWAACTRRPRSCGRGASAWPRAARLRGRAS
eukprot:3885915-Prymnesium_polylepis.2